MAAKIPTLNLIGGGKMPIIGFGAGPNPPDIDNEKVFESALENGYRHIDTAYFYKTEKQIGNVVKRWFDAGKLKRDDLFITSKLPIFGNHPDRVEFFLKKSLEDLQLDYVDLYLIHHPIALKYDKDADRDLKINDQLQFEPPNGHVAIWKKLEEQVDAGRTKAIGLSNFNIPQIQNILNNSRIKPASLQVRLHAYHQQKKLVEFCQKNGIAVVAYSPLGRPQDSVPGKAAITSLNQLEDPVAKEIAKKYSKTVGQILLKHIVQRNIAVIPKSVSPQRQRENLDIFDFTIAEEDLKKLEALDKQGTKDETQFDFLLRFIKHPDYPTGI